MLMYTEQSSIYIQQILPAPSHPQPRKRGIEDGASARPWSYDLRLTGFSECTIHNSYGQAVPAFGRFVLRFVTVRSVTIKVLSPRRVTSARAFFFPFFVAYPCLLLPAALPLSGCDHVGQTFWR